MFLKFASIPEGYVLVKADRIEAISTCDITGETKQSTLTLKSGASVEVAIEPSKVLKALEQTIGLHYIVGFDLSERTELNLTEPP